MTQASDGSPAWADYRARLMVLARLRVDPRLQSKLDLSGVVQQTLLEAHQAGSRWESIAEGQRLAWLKQALAHNLADELRKLNAAKRGPCRQQELAADRSSARLQEWLAADQSSPSDQAVRHEQELALADALNALPEDQREALILQHWHGWSLAEIGVALDRSPTAVAGLIKRGLAKLRAHLTRVNEP
jgi:RNA polymerase sigma-70 factor (ECF subfamily)